MKFQNLQRKKVPYGVSIHLLPRQFSDGLEVVMV